MLTILVPGTEMYDEEKEMFLYTKPVTLQMEHSLISVSKWEARHRRAFLKKEDEKTPEDTLDYFRCMTINKVDPEVFDRLTSKNIEDILKYIDEPMTAVYMMPQKEKGPRGDVPTSELIYYYMITLGIPFECEKWHINKLLALIDVCAMKNKPAKSMSRGEIMRRNSALNAARRKQHHTKG